MESNKSPGSDGLPAEFYKVFWNDINQYLLNALNCAYTKGLLSITQRRGLITLIPKKNKPTNLLKNWRPITLLNCDYKIATKSIASRIRKVLPKIVNNDQTGFLKGRFIGENIGLIDSIINYTNTEKIPGLLLFVDFEKAFDSIEWSFIEKTLKYYNFGTSLVTWVKVFYTDISSCVLNNGWSSDFFNLSRGVRQGCPLSPYLFILCAEILGNTVRKDNEVHGIKIFDTECKLSQYADDTTMILDGSKSSFLRSLYLLDAFASISGLKVNYEKTEALWIGASKSSNLTFPSSKPITWANEKVFALRVWFSTLEDKSALNSNFIEKIEKIRSILDNWSARRLTLLGKITIIKTLAVSQIVYILSSLPTPPDILKTINSILYDFLWDGKGDKIKRTTMINSYAKGGLKMLDIQSFNESLKMKWIQGYLNEENKGKWKLFFNHYLGRYGGKLLFRSNLKQQDSTLLNLKDPFLKEIIQYWTKFNYKDDNLDFASTYIWYNSHIRIENRPFFYRSWLSGGIKEIRDLLDNDQNFLSYNAFIDKYSIKTNYLEYHKAISAVAHYKKVHSTAYHDPTPKDAVDTLLSRTKVSKKIYECQINKKASIPSRSQGKWLEERDMHCNLSIIVNWENTYCLSSLCTRESKLRAFQFKFLHRKIATNDFLYKIGIKQTDSCSFCEEQKETLVHLFWTCKYTQNFWKSMFEWISQNFKDLENVSPSLSLCFGLIDDVKDLLFHHLLLIARHYIYTCRLGNKLPTLQVYTQVLMNSIEIEKQIAFHNNDSNVFVRKWSRFKNNLSQNLLH